MIVGWMAQTASGVRLYQSQRGRFFRDVVAARARENVVGRKHLRRSNAAGRREPYLLHWQHLTGLHVAVIVVSSWHGRAA